MFGGISSELKAKTPRILDVFSSISNPSRGASKIHILQFFHENLLRYFRICKSLSDTADQASTYTRE